MKALASTKPGRAFLKGVVRKRVSNDTVIYVTVLQSNAEVGSRDLPQTTPGEIELASSLCNLDLSRAMNRRDSPMRSSGEQIGQGEC